MELADYLDDFSRRDWQETSDGTVRFAMIALGWWTRDEAIPAVQQSELCETRVVVSGSKEKAETVATEHDEIELGLTYDEFHAGVGSEAYDAVYICTPNALHVPYVETAAELGKAILCEKPMEASLERARELVSTAEDYDVPLMIAYRMHTEPAVRRSRELVTEGMIGEPTAIHGSMTQTILELIPDRDQWRLDPGLVGYGTSVMDIGIYPLNTSRFILDRDPVEAMALMMSSGAGFEDVPDERAAFGLRFEDDILGSFTASQNAAQGSHLKIIGTEGMIDLEPIFYPWSDRQIRVTRGGTATSIEFEQINQMTEEFDYFADCVLADREPYANGHHGLIDMATIDAVYEAAETDVTVPI